MARYIWHDILQGSVKTLSWGVDFYNIKVIHNGTQFHVQGFKVKGTVAIQYDEGHDLFNVTITPDNGEEPIIRENVFGDELVSVIDEIVEKVPNYEKRICQEYGLPIKKTA